VSRLVGLWEGMPMATRALQVEWKSHPTPDGRERLARAVCWVIEHAGPRAPPAPVPADEDAEEPMAEAEQEEVRR
jgi:hypothetical protein